MSEYNCGIRNIEDKIKSFFCTMRDSFNDDSKELYDDVCDYTREDTNVNQHCYFQYHVKNPYMVDFTPETISYYHMSENNKKYYNTNNRVPNMHRHPLNLSNAHHLRRRNIKHNDINHKNNIQNMDSSYTNAYPPIDLGISLEAKQKEYQTAYVENNSKHRKLQKEDMY